jgi:predicted CoA-substrate-specific enzyme activase
MTARLIRGMRYFISEKTSMGNLQYAIGLCLGASSVSAVCVAQAESSCAGAEKTPSRPWVIKHNVYPHGGSPQALVQKAIEDLGQQKFYKMAATGRKYRHILNLPSISEPEAVEYAYSYVKPPGRDCPALISAGGETFMVYALSPKGRITNVITGNKCASGTGEFFLQQLRRMNVDISQAASWAAETQPYPVSGRCSVFCKSDCTHATNKGIPKPEVTAGLGKMMADKILELLKKIDRRNLMLVGGTAKNQMMVHFLNQSVKDLIIPRQAPYFEALGAALWALENEPRPVLDLDQLFISRNRHSKGLPPLHTSEASVTFKQIHKAAIRTGDTCLLGLDVGSTTTKAVLIRKSDNAQLASVYLRTDGDPIAASRKCYARLYQQMSRHVDPDSIAVVGLGICGSGRHIAGLHAMSPAIINEITAHAAAAVYYDPQVDTIIEIGGQDAKYTHITNSVPTDYAMNEACSAGTGSFLEESALETLGIPMERIASVALQGQRPPNFNDQCSAFIASDIKNAIHDGIAMEDIMAGLVYSVCMNYINRVKGNRPVGHKVFMQGGVCYNKAVPLAMAVLTDKPIIVPPEPGLMGAFGVALEVKKRLDNGMLDRKKYDLAVLAEREISYGRPFVCKGRQQQCDRRCKIARIEIDGHSYPFGGACSRFDNLRQKRKTDTQNLDLVRTRERLIFDKYAPEPVDSKASRYRGKVGINRSFLVHTYYPLYAGFFSSLGFDPVLAQMPKKAGIDQRNAPFCFPAELSHGFFYDLIDRKDPPQYIFLPHVKSIPIMDGARTSQVCPLAQAEPFYLRATFRRQLRLLEKKHTKIFSPTMHLSSGLAQGSKPLVETAIQMGVSRKEANEAFAESLTAMNACHQEMVAAGRRALSQLVENPDQIAVVLFARPYNGYAPEAHMGIPRKFASRGVMVLPLDFLNIDGLGSRRFMYWGMGQRIMMAARKVISHPQLFGAYITNFSCGPDSFLLGYFRELMGRKPSLTLELDSHTADAGLETRIDAFLDIITAYRKSITLPIRRHTQKEFRPARTAVENAMLVVETSDGRKVPLTDPDVTLLIPSMGELGTQCLAAAMRGAGYHAHAHHPSNEAILKLGRGNTSCKECLPLILTTGTLLDYIRHHRRPDEIVVYFMPKGSGPCRFGQYHIFIEDLIKKHHISNTAVYSLSSDRSYDRAPNGAQRRMWWGIVISDVFEDMRAMLLANARDRETGMAVFQDQFAAVVNCLKKSSFKTLETQLHNAAMHLGRVPLQQPVENIPIISLTGEIFVRRDGLSRRYLTEYLAEKGFATRCAPVAEWIHYTDYTVRNKFSDYFHKGLTKRIVARIRCRIRCKDEQRIKKLLQPSGLTHCTPILINELIDTAKPYISPYLGGEAILTVGSSLKEVASQACGVIAIGPFGCMPNRISEAILNEVMQREDKLASEPQDHRLPIALSGVDDLPFLAIESDGLPFPQLIHAKLEAFCLRAQRLHQRMQYSMNAN